MSEHIHAEVSDHLRCSSTSTLIDKVSFVAATVHYPPGKLQDSEDLLSHLNTRVLSYMCSEDSNSDPRTCSASTLTTELSP